MTAPKKKIRTSFRSITLSLVLLALALSGVFAGGELFWSQSIVGSICCIGLLISLVDYYKGRQSVILNRWAWLYLICIVLLALLMEVQSSQEFGWAIAKADSNRQALTTWIYAVFAYLAFTTIKSKSDLRKALWLLVGVGAIHSVVGVALYFSEFEGYVLLGERTSYKHAKGFFFVKNNFASFLNLSFFALFALRVEYLANSREQYAAGIRRFKVYAEDYFQGKRFLATIAMLIMLIALVLSHSRAGNAMFEIFAVAFGFSLLWLFRHEREFYVQKIKTFFYLLLFAVVFSATAGSGLTNSISNVLLIDSTIAAERDVLPEKTLEEVEQAIKPSEYEDSLRGRTLPAVKSIQQFLQKPLFGWGAANFQYVYLPVKDEAASIGFYRYLHVDPMQMLIENGVVGGALFMMLLILPMVRTLGRLFSSQVAPDTKAMILSISFGLNAVVLHSFVDFPFQIFGVVIPFILMTVCLMRLVDFSPKINH